MGRRHQADVPEHGKIPDTDRQSRCQLHTQEVPILPEGGGLCGLQGQRERDKHLRKNHLKHKGLPQAQKPQRHEIIHGPGRTNGTIPGKGRGTTPLQAPAQRKDQRRLCVVRGTDQGIQPREKSPNKGIRRRHQEI